MFTSMFLHVNLLHLAGNMLYLWIFGNNIEDGWAASGSSCSTSWAASRRSSPRSLIDPTSRGPDGRRVGRDRGGPRRVPRAVPGGADPVARVPRLLLPAASRSRRSSSSASGSCSSSSTGSRRSASPAPRAASRSSPTSAASWPGVAIGLLVRGTLAGRGRSSGLPPCRRGIIAAMANEDLPDTGLVEMVVESVRVHMLSSRHVVILKETERERYLPIWIGPWEASAIAMRLQGLDAGAAAHPRPVRGGARGARRRASTGSSSRRSPRRRSTPGCSSSATAATVEVDSRPSDALALAVRAGGRIFAVRGGPRPGRRSARTAAIGEDDEESAGGIAARDDRRADRRPAARRVPRLRELARRRPGRGRASGAGQLGRRPARRGSASPRRSARARFDPQPQPERPEVAHGAEDDAAASRRSASRPSAGSAGTPTSTIGRPGRAQLDQQLGREERAARLDRDPLERLAPEQLAGAVDVADLSPKKIRLASR